MQTNLEEAKAQEVAKLQNSLQEMQNKVDETNALLVKERENVKKVVEDAPPVIKETQVLVEDTQKIESLTGEVESLKVREFILTIHHMYFQETLLSSMYLLMHRWLLQILEASSPVCLLFFGFLAKTCMPFVKQQL